MARITNRFEMARLLGRKEPGPERTQEQYRRDKALITNNLSTLKKEHSGQWVGVVNGDFVFASDIGNLFAQLGERKTRAAICYLGVQT